MALEYFVKKDDNNYPIEERTQDAAEADLEAPWEKVTKEQLDQLYIDNQAAKDLADAWKSIRDQRDKYLTDCEWVLHRHKDETDLKLDNTLSAEEYIEYLTYRQSLRDVPNSAQSPNDVVWPNKPDFI